MNGSSIVVRNCLRSDIGAVCRIEQACFKPAEALHRVVLTQYLDLCGSAFFVALSSNQIIGFGIGGIALSSHFGLGWVLDVAVAPSSQGKNVGTLLCEHVLDLLTRIGATKIRATVSPDNDRSLRMLSHLKFHTIADIPDYFGCGERRLLMQLSRKDYSGHELRRPK